MLGAHIHTIFSCSVCHSATIVRQVLHHAACKPSLLHKLLTTGTGQRIGQHGVFSRSLSGSVSPIHHLQQAFGGRGLSHYSWLKHWIRDNHRSHLFLAGGLLLGSYITLATSSRSQSQTEPTVADILPLGDDKQSDILSLDKELTFSQKLKLSLRFMYLCLLSSPALLLHTLFYLTGSSYIEKLEVRYILFVLQMAGPAFIKLGQWASTRRDLFSENFCTTISCLHTHCDPHPWSGTTKLLAESFGKDWEKYLLIVDRNPIGSGCVAQVYQGYLRNTQEGAESAKYSNQSSTMSDPRVPIAVKVVHPGVVEAMDLDIRLMKYVASWVDYVYPDMHWIALKECVDEFAITMRKQLDLEIEAKNLSKFRVLMTGYDGIKFPTPLYPFVTETVLVETYEQGDHISEYLNEPGGHLQKTLAKMGIEMLLDMLFVHNFVHGDLHPGNLLVQDPFSDDPKLVVIDCGIATSLGPVDFENFYKVFKAIVCGDGETVADLFLGTQTCKTLGKYRRDMAELIDEQAQHLNLRELQVCTLFSRLFNILIDHKVRIDANYTSVMVAFMVIEGVARSLDPSMDIMIYAKPCILQRSKFAIREQLKKTVRQKWLF